jgi:hypothetical protein
MWLSLTGHRFDVGGFSRGRGREEEEFRKTEIMCNELGYLGSGGRVSIRRTGESPMDNFLPIV